MSPADPHAVTLRSSHRVPGRPEGPLQNLGPAGRSESGPLPATRASRRSPDMPMSSNIVTRVAEGPQWAALTTDIKALALFAYLEAENGAAVEFTIADGLGLVCGWPRRFVPTARNRLLALGIVERVMPAAPNRCARYRWKGGQE